MKITISKCRRGHWQNFCFKMRFMFMDAYSYRLKSISWYLVRIDLVSKVDVFVEKAWLTETRQKDVMFSNMEARSSDFHICQTSHLSDVPKVRYVMKITMAKCGRDHWQNLCFHSTVLWSHDLIVLNEVSYLVIFHVFSWRQESDKNALMLSLTLSSILSDAFDVECKYERAQ